MFLGKRKAKEKTMKVTKDTIIIDVIRQNPDTARYFYAIGMHCIGCAMANAGAAVRTAADRIVESNNDAGVGKEIFRILAS